MKALKIVRNITIFAAVCAIVFLVISMFYERASDYTDSQHIQRVTDLARKRYLNENSEYTDLEVYPLYTENNKLGYFLIEFKPHGFVYVELREKSFFRDYIGLYLRDFNEGHDWVRTIYEEGHDVVYTDNKGAVITIKNTRFLELDENDQPILYNISHFKAAEIKDERHYFLSARGSHIPAVKRDGKYFNLISLECIDYNSIAKDNQHTSTAFSYFLPKSEFRL